MYPPQPLRSHFEQEILALEQQLWRLRSDKARSALRDSDEPNYLNSPKRAAAPTVQRSYSAESQMAMDDLAVVSDEAARLQRISEQAEVQLRLAERFGEPVDPALRNQCGLPVILWPREPHVMPHAAPHAQPPSSVNSPLCYDRLGLLYWDATKLVERGRGSGSIVSRARSATDAWDARRLRDTPQRPKPTYDCMALRTTYPGFTASTRSRRLVRWPHPRDARASGGDRATHPRLPEPCPYLPALQLRACVRLFASAGGSGEWAAEKHCSEVRR